MKPWPNPTVFLVSRERRAVAVGLVMDSMNRAMEWGVCEYLIRGLEFFTILNFLILFRQKGTKLGGENSKIIA